MALIFLKLGGSLITDKQQVETPRLEVLRTLAQEIAEVRRSHPDLQLVLGHGSGSFGHVVGKRYGTRQGVHSPQQWYGFAATHDAAARLNRLVTATLLAAEVPAWSIQPSAVLRCVDGVIVEGPLAAVQRAVAAGVTPLVYGDVALDDVRGGTIVSTEEIFAWLAQRLQPKRMVLVGEVDGVYSADPRRDPTAQPIPRITPQTMAGIASQLGESHGVDVTGGMATKVKHALTMVSQTAGLEIVICSGLTQGNLHQALTSTVAPGTLICAG